MDVNPYPPTDEVKGLRKCYSGTSQKLFSRDRQKRYSDPQKRYSGLSQKRWSQLSNPLSKDKTRDPDESETYRLRDFATQTSFVLGEIDDSRLSWKDHGAEDGIPPDELPKSFKDERGPPTIPPKEDPNLVTWDGPDDPANPQNWGLNRKLFITAIWVYATMVAAIGSSIFASGALEVVNHFHVSATVATLGVSLFLLGYATGPPLWGPLSEVFGRKIPLLIAISCFTLFCLPVALGQNIQTVLIGRFFCGLFGAAPPSILGGAIVDIWNPVNRGVALAACVGAIFGTPILAPLMGNFVAASYLGWRWDNWLSAIMGLACSIVILLFLPETFAVVLLKKKAERRRRETGNPDAHSVFDGEKKDFRTIVRVYLVRPFVMLAHEPILTLVTIYQAFTFGILYLIFVAYPIAFQEVRHWELGVSGLAYLGLLIGVFCGAATVVWHTKTRFAHTTEANNGVVIPEQRLPTMIFGGCLLPVGLFIFAWTSHPNIHWIGMEIGSVLVGMGLYMVFVQAINYIIDVYLPMANSAVASNTFVRSLFGAGFPLFGPTMFHRLGVDWATTTLAFIGIAMIPIPILFYIYGARIRAWSKMAINTR